MGRTPALKAAQEKYRKSRERIELVLAGELKEAFQAAAAKQGLSVATYIIEAARNRMEIERDATEPPQDIRAQAAESP